MAQLLGDILRAVCLCTPTSGLCAKSRPRGGRLPEVRDPNAHKGGGGVRPGKRFYRFMGKFRHSLTLCIHTEM